MPTIVNIYNNNGQYKNVNPYIETKRNKNLVNYRNNNCKTPFRMPLNQYRKTSDCRNCEPNTKVLKDNHALYCCYDPYIKNILNVGGKISNKFIYSKAHLLHKQNKLYNQNVSTNFQSNISLEDSSHNFLVSHSDISNNKIMPCRRATYKVRNRNHACNGAVSGRARINRLKYNAVTARIVSNYKSFCPGRNNNCYDENLARYRVDISRPKPCKSFSDKIGRKFSCNPNYTKQVNIEDINILYTYPKYEYNATPPPLNGLATLHYFNNHYNYFASFRYEPLEFNTNYDNMNRQAYVGPIQTTNTTVSNINKEYQTIITKHSVTYVTKTPDVTVVTNIIRTSGEIETNTYVTGTEIIPDDFDVNEPEAFRRTIISGTSNSITTEYGNIQYTSSGTFTDTSIVPSSSTTTTNPTTNTTYNTNTGSTTNTNTTTNPTTNTTYNTNTGSTTNSTTTNSTTTNNTTTTNSTTTTNNNTTTTTNNNTNYNSYY